MTIKKTGIKEVLQEKLRTGQGVSHIELIQLCDVINHNATRVESLVDKLEQRVNKLELVEDSVVIFGISRPILTKH